MSVSDHIVGIELWKESHADYVVGMKYAQQGHWEVVKPDIAPRIRAWESNGKTLEGICKEVITTYNKHFAEKRRHSSAPEFELAVELLAPYCSDGLTNLRRVKASLNPSGQYNFAAAVIAIAVVVLLIAASRFFR